MDMASAMHALLGGVLIGIASIIVLKAHGRVEGVSGIVGGLFKPNAGDVGWRVAFGTGLLLAGSIATIVSPDLMRIEGTPGVVGVMVAGLLVGFGTRLGNGCTSGHGVCGVSRLSPRSIAATLVFMLFGGLTVFVVRHMGWGVGA